MNGCGSSSLASQIAQTLTVASCIKIAVCSLIKSILVFSGEKRAAFTSSKIVML